MGLQVGAVAGDGDARALAVRLGGGWYGPLAGTAAGMALAVVYAWRHDWAGARFSIDRATLHRACAYGLPLSLTVALLIVI